MRCSSGLIPKVSGRDARQVVEVKDHGLEGEAVPGVETLGAVVRGIRRYRGSPRSLLSSPRKECCHQLLANAAATMTWIDVDTLQFCDPDRMHAARAAEAPHQMTHRFITVARQQNQVVSAGEEGSAVGEAGLRRPAEIGRGGVVPSGVGHNERVCRGEDFGDIVRRRHAGPDRHLTRLPSLRWSSRNSKPGTGAWADRWQATAGLGTLG